MRKTLLVTRHADAAWDGDPPTDHERALTARGEEQARALSALLGEQGLAPDVVISSTAKRAQQTAALIVEGMPEVLTVQPVQALYQGGMSALRAAIEPLANDVATVMVVGHNPAMSSVASRMAGEKLGLRTATCVTLTCDAQSWEEAFEGRWTLRSLCRPDVPERSAAGPSKPGSASA